MNDLWHFLTTPWYICLFVIPMVLAYLVPVCCGVDLKRTLMLGMSMQVFVLTCASFLPRIHR